jgi:MFS family permease
MTSALLPSPSAPPALTRIAERPGLPAFALLASIAVALLAASSAPTPIYAVYQAQWGFSPITTTVIFGVYAIAVLASLVTVGSLSDHLGRRPVLLAALIVQAATMLLFAQAQGAGDLMIARIIQGLSTGAALGAVGAGMLDLDRARGTVANAVGPMTGTAVGAATSSLLVHFCPAPTHLVYLVLFVILAAQAVGVAIMAEPSRPVPGAWASLRLRIAIPQAARRPLLLAVPILVATWALAGFYGSLGPALVHAVTQSPNVLLGGLAVFTLAGSSALCVLLLTAAHARTAQLVGTLALLGGVGLTLLSVTDASTIGFFVGTAIAGAGFGAGVQGAIRSVIPHAAPHERAGLLSVVYVVSYLAMGLPAVLAGVLVVHGGGVLTTARAYGLVVMLLAAVALVGVLRSPGPAARA